MSTATATPAAPSQREKTTTLERLTGINVQSGQDGKAFIRFNDSYKFPKAPRTFHLVDQSERAAAAKTETQKNMPAWDVHAVIGGKLSLAPIAGAWETIAQDRDGKTHGRINFTDPYTHRRYVLFVYGEPQPTPNGGAEFHGSASVDMNSGAAAAKTLSRFGGPAAVTQRAADTETTDLDPPQGSEGAGNGSETGEDPDKIPF